MKFLKFIVLGILFAVAQSMSVIPAVASGMPIPAKPGVTRSLTLTDGTTVVATLVGDEHGHYWLGQDGRAYLLITGTDTYQPVDAAQIQRKAAVRRANANQRRMNRMPRKIGSVGSITGQKKGLIILVNFTDVSFQSANNKALYQRIANEENFSYGSFKGSMYDYFKAQSEGQFELTFDVVGPVTVSKAQAYYGGNDSKGNDKYPATMVIEALKLVDPQVNFADYDWDGDGEVEQVYVVYAGNGAADSDVDDAIWPHEWTLSSANYYGDGAGRQRLDNVYIDTYACGGELNGSNNIAGIGTMCHEFSHCLGYPDFYDTDYSGGQGMGYWDLMDSGSYNDNGYQPAGYTSYERWVAGWKEPAELLNTQSVSSMAALQTTGSNTYVIYNKANNNEYYLLENRQKTGWDSSLPGAGLLVLHVDYSSSAWENNEPNDDPSHQRMTWIPADNQYQYTTNSDGSKSYTFSGMKNDPFPYGNVKAFNKTTTPAAKFYNKNSDNSYYLDSSVENITQNSDGTISFNFVGVSNVVTPTFSPVAGRYTEAQTVTINCETNGATIYYTTDGTTPTSSSTPYTSPLTVNETKTIKAVAIKDGEESSIATATYKIGATSSNPNTTAFRRVQSVEDLESGLLYVIACGSKNMAAGSLNNSYLTNVSVSITDNVLTSTDNVAVFILEGDQTNGWSFQNESTKQYLVSNATKSVSYNNTTAGAWTLSDGTNGVVMSYGDFGTMLYNVSSPRFTTYTSNPTASMIQANLYVEDSSATPVTPDPLIVADESLEFSTVVGTPQNKSFEVLSEGLTQDITATLTDGGGVFSLGSTTISRTESELGATVNVTFTPMAAGNYTGKVTLSSAGAESVEVSLSGTATESTTPVDPTPTGNEFTLLTKSSDFTEGDYIIVYDGGAMNTEVSSNRLQYTDVTPSNNVITTTDATIIWHIAPSGDHYTIYNAGENKYAASNGTKNQAQLLASGSDDKSLWTVTTGSTFEFVNKYNETNTVNANLRRNGTYGFACYASGTGGALSLYKRTGSSSGGDDPTPDPSTDYYQPADGKTGVALKTAMCGIIYNRTEKSYDDLWNAFKTTDVRSDGKIWDMYSDITNYTPVTSGSNYSKEGDCYNREHSWPQSWFGSNAPMYTDLHHIYPTDGFVNGKRANYPFGEVSNPTYSSENSFSKLGPCSYSGYTGTVFEPADEYKGDFARTYFYMVTCYEEKLHDWYTNYNSTDVVHVIDGSTYPGLQEWQLNMLMEWAKNDPVSEKETARNEAVYAIQNNRNPFIDYPGLQEYIWGFMTTSTFSYDHYIEPVYNKQDVTMAFSPSEAKVTLGEDITEPTLTTTPANLTVSYDSSNTDVATVNASTGEVTLVAAGTTTITATFAGNDNYNAGAASYTLTVSAASTPDPVGTENFALVTDASTLAAGDKILIAYVNGNTRYVLSTTQNENNRAATTDVTLNTDGTLTPGEEAQVITLEKDGTNYLFNVGNGYLYAASSSKNYLRTKATADANAKAAISISSNNATITFQGDNTRNSIRYNPNNNSPIFSCYSGTSTGSAPQIYREVKAVPVTLENASDNSSTIAANDGKLAVVTLNGRTFYKDNSWNTLCVPFAVESFAGTPLEGATVKKMGDSSAFEGSTGTLTLNFTDVTAIDAGKAYVMKWENGTNVVNPVFKNVVISSSVPQATTSSDGLVQFVGTYKPVGLELNTSANLYMGDESTLYYPTETGFTVKAFRAYFLVDLSEGGEVRQMNLNFDDAVTGLTTGWSDASESGYIYDLQGRRLSKGQMGKGIYIINGKKVLK